MDKRWSIIIGEENLLFRNMATAKPKDIDEYISGFPVDVQHVLQKIRATIIKTVPDAEETISYGIPAFNLNKVTTQLVPI